ncbi:hypothetical protein diail_5479, partial [Diaporthe ilicicola]
MAEGRRPPALNSFDHDPSVAEFAVPKQAYLAARPGAGLGSDIAARLSQLARALHDDDNNNDRGAGDEHDPSKWEAPGGWCEDADESILHGAARELWGGGRARGGPDRGDRREALPLRLALGCRSCQFNFVIGGLRAEGEGQGQGPPAVRLDPQEHQR